LTATAFDVLRCRLEVGGADSELLRGASERSAQSAEWGRELLAKMHELTAIPSALPTSTVSRVRAIADSYRVSDMSIWSRPFLRSQSLRTRRIVPYHELDRSRTSVTARRGKSQPESAERRIALTVGQDPVLAHVFAEE